MEYVVKLKATKHAQRQSRDRRVSIPRTINLADEQNLILGPWMVNGEPKVIILVPLVNKAGQVDYYKRLPAVCKGDNFQELHVVSVMLRETARIGKKAKTFKDWMKHLHKSGMLF